MSAAAVRSGHRAFYTFAVGYDDGDRHSELAHARAVAEHVGSRHHELRIGPDAFADGLDQLVWQTDEPLADLAAIPLHRLSVLARDHVKVVLSGEGADEVLAGYSFERMAAGLNRFRFLRRAPRELLRLGARGIRGERGAALRALAQGGWAGYPAAMGTHISWTMDERDKARLWRAGPPPRTTEELLASWYANCPSPEPLDRAQQVAMGSWLVEDLLMKADKATMAASIELRCPFLDHRLVEWCARLPMRWKVGDPEVGMGLQARPARRGRPVAAGRDDRAAKAGLSRCRRTTGWRGREASGPPAASRPADRWPTCSRSPPSPPSSSALAAAIKSARSGCGCGWSSRRGCNAGCDPRRQALNPTAHQNGGDSENRTSRSPAADIISVISERLKRCSSLVPKRS